MLELANKLEARFTMIVGDNEIVGRRPYALKEHATGQSSRRIPRHGELLERVEERMNMAEVKLDFLGDFSRTHSCGELRASDAGTHGAC